MLGWYIHIYELLFRAGQCVVVLPPVPRSRVFTSRVLYVVRRENVFLFTFSFICLVFMRWFIFASQKIGKNEHLQKSASIQPRTSLLMFGSEKTRRLDAPAGRPC